jgi:SAM-dependent methyltransferase
MNLAHRWLCRSGFWRQTVERYVFPWVLEGIELGPEILEIGPGPGVTTDLLRHRASRLTCVEIDPTMAGSLSRRLVGTNVTVRCEDATTLSLPDSTFDAALSFTMLHHVQSAAQQDRLLAEVSRVLRPGGIFAGTDSIYSPSLRLLHMFDTMVLVDPRSFPARLTAAGFTGIQVDVNEHAFRFRARVAKGTAAAQAPS